MKILKYVILFCMILALTIPLLGCNSEDENNQEYAAKITQELSNVELLPIKDYSNVLEKYIIQDKNEAKIIFICKLFGREVVQKAWLKNASFVNDSKNYVSIFVNPDYIGHLREIKSNGMFGFGGMVQSIEDFDKQIRTDNYLSNIVSHYEFHLDLNKIDDYILKIKPIFDNYGNLNYFNYYDNATP